MAGDDKIFSLFDQERFDRLSGGELACGRFITGDPFEVLQMVAVVGGAGDSLVPTVQAVIDGRLTPPGWDRMLTVRRAADR